MRNCENQATHQVSETKQQVCGEHASQAKRDGALVELKPATGGRAACKHVEPEDIIPVGEPESEGAD